MLEACPEFEVHNECARSGVSPRRDNFDWFLWILMVCYSCGFFVLFLVEVQSFEEWLPHHPTFPTDVPIRHPGQAQAPAATKDLKAPGGNLDRPFLRKKCRPEGSAYQVNDFLTVALRHLSSIATSCSGLIAAPQKLSTGRPSLQPRRRIGSGHRPQDATWNCYVQMRPRCYGPFNGPPSSLRVEYPTEKVIPREFRNLGQSPGLPARQEQFLSNIGEGDFGDKRHAQLYRRRRSGQSTTSKSWVLR